MTTLRAFPYLLLLVLSLSIVLPVRADVDADRKALLEGVTAISAPGAIPGPLAVFGEKAFVVMTAREGKSRVPLIAAARWERGRIVALGHEAFIGRAARDPDNARFLHNAVLWAGRGKPNPQTLRVGTFEPETLSVLRTAEADAVLLENEDYADLGARLKNLDVLYLNQSVLDGRAAAIRAVREWIRNDGGGVILAGPAWGWKQVTGKDLVTEQSANRVARDAGIAWADGMLDATARNGGYLADAVGAEAAHARNALDRLTRHAEGKATLAAPELAQATQVLALTVGALPAEEATVAARVSALCERFARTLVPTKTRPVTPNNPFARLKAVLDHRGERRLPPERIRANPAAADFPGAVPPDATRHSRKVTVEPVRGGWFGTGLYAPPGEVVTVQVPVTLTGRGFVLRIGAHTDTLWHLEKWERWPEIARRFPLDRANVRVASPFGGGIFVETPENAPVEPFTLTVGNVIDAPYFVRGKTTADEWRKSRLAPAPWAELAGKRVALTVPSEVVRTLDDPDALMTYWDEVMDACAAFYAVPEIRRQPQRYCVDRQISAGYMHSGYPIMTWEDVAARFVDLPVLRGKDGEKVWGFYHELGHNHQKPEWTWDGCGEVTNNLFSLYGSERFNGVTPDYATSHPAMRPEERTKRETAYLTGGAKYEQWKSDPFLALTLFARLRQAFGWEPFTRVFAQYEALPDAERPKTDLEKHDQFLVRFSKAVGKNLGPFFVRWGVPTSDAARREVASLPVWEPETTSGETSPARGRRVLE
ncbi:MAG: M60 family metallopeptidase [Capsulimonadales bacterium]|nr:M60 family metallopeptidase [Capsulimonadales bacterium]